MFEANRFNNITIGLINQDNHIHTNWTDGQHSPEEIVNRAEEIGLKSICFTEHIRKKSDYFEAFFQHIDLLRKKHSINILIGVEAKVINYDGELDISDKNLKLAEVVLGSVHRIPYNNGFVFPKELSRDELNNMEYKLCVGLIKNENINILAHPVGMSVKLYGDFPKEYLEDIICRISKTKIAFEINSSYVTPEFISTVHELCRKYNPYISIGSDVHKIEVLGKCRHIVKGFL